MSNKNQLSSENREEALKTVEKTAGIGAGAGVGVAALVGAPFLLGGLLGGGIACLGAGIFKLLDD